VAVGHHHFHGHQQEGNMSTLSGALTALAGPLAKKVLTSVGIGLVTYAGLDAAVTAGLSAAKSALGGIGTDYAAIAAMFGFFTACSVIAGGITAGLTMMSFKKLAVLT
jgi:hypothetical protein